MCFYFENPGVHLVWHPYKKKCWKAFKEFQEYTAHEGTWGIFFLSRSHVIPLHYLAIYLLYLAIRLRYLAKVCVPSQYVCVTLQTFVSLTIPLCYRTILFALFRKCLHSLAVHLCYLAIRLLSCNMFALHCNRLALPHNMFVLPCNMLSCNTFCVTSQMIAFPRYTFMLSWILFALFRKCLHSLAIHLLPLQTFAFPHNIVLRYQAKDGFVGTKLNQTYILKYPVIRKGCVATSS